MRNTLFICLAILLFLQPVFTQEVGRHYYFTDQNITTPLFNGDPSSMEDYSLIYSVEIGESEAPFLRLYFGNSNLGNESYVKITSLYDNIVQVHNSVTLTSWKNTSIFFNGDELLVELYLYKYDNDIQVILEKLLVGERVGDQSSQLSRTICGEDDRVSSDDNSVARMVPVGCTAWIANNGLLISAGHCHYYSDDFSEEIIQFNVPISLDDGTIQHPGVEDQYIIGDYVNHNFVYGAPPGIDWLVFNVFDNHTTGLQPITVQGAYFELERTDTFDDNEEIRITGYGVDGPPPDYGSYNSPRNEDSQIQQTDLGDFYSLSGTRLNYVVDTQGANSGSPIIRENNGKVIGVHTNGGCSSTSGYNSGTSLLNNNFWDAIGVDVTATLTNKNFETDELLEGLLSLKELETGTEIIVNSLDEEEIPLSIENSYTARTFNFEIDELFHHNWNINNSYLIKWENINIPGGVNNFPVTAFYQNKFQVSITSDNPVELQILDPWYVENPDDTDPNNWIQPNDFRVITPEQYNVFLGQGGEIGNLTPPYYSLRAPKVYGNNSGLYEFSHWNATPASEATIVNSNNSKTPVVFHNENVSIEAVYSETPINNIPNSTLNIGEDELLFIPPGSDITFADNFTINVYGGVVDIQNAKLTGSVDNNGIPTATIDIDQHSFADIDNSTLENIALGIGRNRFFTYQLNNNVNLVYSEFENVYVQIYGSAPNYPNEVNLLDIINCTWVNSYISSLLEGNYTYPVEWPLTLTNNIFYNTDFNLNIDDFIEVNNHYNLYYNSVYSFADNATCIVDENPNFVDPQNGNYQLENNSPAIDGGDPNSPLDPDGTMADMGAYYFHQPPTPPTHFRIRGRPGQSPRLTYRFGESDVHAVEIWRSWSGGPFHLLATVVNATQYIDTEVIIAGNWSLSDEVCYELYSVDDEGYRSTQATGPECELAEIGIKELAMPEQYTLHQAFPNPFNSEITIKYELPERSEITLLAYDLLGRKIKTFKSETEEAGRYSIKWQGNDELGNSLTSGMYIIQMTAKSMESGDDFTKAQKVVLMK